ncbi:MAG: branched-chain amino acid ABC transporter substrate-binding protein [Chloroflexi bacterium]|nr:MAG: branched-chain amino acid ABC transporter substrate-binding protein [Chloroflexota bacterium]
MLQRRSSVSTSAALSDLTDRPPGNRFTYTVLMRGTTLAGVLGLAAVLATACGTANGTNAAPSAGAPIVFGAAVSLTGAQSKEGALTKQGYDLWLDWINQRGGIVAGNVKHPVQIKYEDDQSKADLSATLVQKLITDEKAQFILGPYGSAATATDAVIAEKNGIPMVEANGAAQAIFNKGYKFTFGVLSPANKYLTGVLDMAATLSPKPTRIAMLTANDNFSVEVARAVEDYAASKGMQVVFSKQYPAAAPDVSGLVSQAKQANPDIVLNSGHLAEAIAINKAAKQLDLNAKIFAYSVGPSTPDFISALGPDANFVYDGSQWTPQVKYHPAFYLSVSDYVKAYQQKYGGSEPPDYHVAESTAACLAFQKAVENAGSLDPAKIRDALASLDVMTFFGEIKFDSRGINVYKPMVVEQIQNGVHYTVYPADVANGKPKYPTPAWGSR